MKSILTTKINNVLYFLSVNVIGKE